MKDWRVVKRTTYQSNWDEDYKYTIYEGTKIVGTIFYEEDAYQIVKDHNEKVQMANVLMILKG